MKIYFSQLIFWNIYGAFDKIQYNKTNGKG